MASSVLFSADRTLSQQRQLHLLLLVVTICFFLTVETSARAVHSAKHWHKAIRKIRHIKKYAALLAELLRGYMIRNGADAESLPADNDELLELFLENLGEYEELESPNEDNETVSAQLVHPLTILKQLQRSRQDIEITTT